MADKAKRRWKGQMTTDVFVPSGKNENWYPRKCGVLTTEDVPTQLAADGLGTRDCR
jgi:hypothetical protein